MAGVVMRFLPPGHSSLVKSIGQFSMAIRTPLSSANWINGFHVLRKRGQLSSTLFVQSRPMKLVVVFKPSMRVATITFFRCSICVSTASRLGSSTFG